MAEQQVQLDDLAPAQLQEVKKQLDEVCPLLLYLPFEHPCALEGVGGR
jgi:hypothetical protein